MSEKHAEELGWELNIGGEKVRVWHGFMKLCEECGQHGHLGDGHERYARRKRKMAQRKRRIARKIRERVERGLEEGEVEEEAQETQVPAKRSREEDSKPQSLYDWCRRKKLKLKGGARGMRSFKARKASNTAGESRKAESIVCECQRSYWV